jgi:predicted transport protein
MNMRRQLYIYKNKHPHIDYVRTMIVHHQIRKLRLKLIINSEINQLQEESKSTKKVRKQSIIVTRVCIIDQKIQLYSKQESSME